MVKLKGKLIRIHDTEAIKELVDPAIQNSGYDIVRVQYINNSSNTLQIMIERRDRSHVSVDDCSIVSRVVSNLLDVEAVASEEYTLEVSSPGIDRPLVKIADFVRFEGFVVLIETVRQISGRKKISGRISSVVGDNIEIECDGKSIILPFEKIKCASLVLTDELIENSRRRTSSASQMEH